MGRVTAWNAEDENTYYVSTSKTVTVDRGYYYRAHADHIAGPADGEKDLGNSLTDGIKDQLVDMICNDQSIPGRDCASRFRCFW